MKFLLSGDDTYRSTRRLAHLRERFCGLPADQSPAALAKADTSEGACLNVIEIEAGRDGVEPLLEAMLTVPFLAEKKLVVARGFLRAESADQEEIAVALPRLADTTSVIFFENAPAKEIAAAPLYPLLRDEKHTQDFPAVAAGEAGRFFAGEMESRGVSLTPAAVHLAAELIAPDSWQIIQEAEKLAAWCLARGLDVADEKAVAEVVTSNKEEPAFAFLDACLSGQPRRAIARLASLFAAGENEHQVLAGITRQIRTLVAVRDFLDRGVSDKQTIARELKLHPFPVEKAMRACLPAGQAGSSLDAALLRRLFEAALDVERQLKTGENDRAAVELLAVRLAAAAGKR